MFYYYEFYKKCPSFEKISVVWYAQRCEDEGSLEEDEKEDE